jgi:DeoR/GlpR family transcriptional regulator of sugar metabolism
MIPSQRDALILGLLRDRGVVTVRDIAAYCECSQMSIRRDLRRLEAEGAIQRTHGGATLPPAEDQTPANRNGNLSLESRAAVLSQCSVLILTPVKTVAVELLAQRAACSGIPIIAESIDYPGATAVIAIDDYAAGLALGRWTGEAVADRLTGHVTVLDVSSSLPNCVARSRGFADGLKDTLPGRHAVLRLDGKDVRHKAREVVLGALSIHPDVDVIVGINDDSALGALDAYREAGLDESRLVVVSFGLEGDEVKSLLAARGPYKAAAAMFPELAGRACVDAAVCAYHGCALPKRVVIPAMIVTGDDLANYYELDPASCGWALRAGAMQRLAALSPSLAQLNLCETRPRPERIGFLEAFSSHAWYRHMQRAMLARARVLGTRLEVLDASCDLDYELDLLARRIGCAAAQLVAEGDTITLDTGKPTAHLAAALCGRNGITVITNSLAVLAELASAPGIRLISSGGTVRSANRALIGRGAEETFRGLRASKAFITGDGLSIAFGLSSMSTSELGVKQAMIEAAREVIVLADHTAIGAESLVRVAGLDHVDRVVTDNGISATDRFLLQQNNVEVNVAV